MVVAPMAAPVTKPLVPMVAAEGFVLLQTPPTAMSDSVVDAPLQSVDAPLILPATGLALTVIIAVAATVPQLKVTVKEMVVVPAATPVTIPSVPMVAAAVLVLLQTPPPATSERAIDAPVQTEDAPLILPAEAIAFTVIIAVAAAVPQPLVTV